MKLLVSAYVASDDPEHVARAAEVFARAVTGLALDGIEATLTIAPDTTPEEEAP